MCRLRIAHSRDLTYMKPGGYISDQIPTMELNR